MPRAIALILMFALSSCTLILKWTLGISKIKEEPIPEQIEYFVNNGLDTSHMFNLKDSFCKLFVLNKYPMYSFDTFSVKPIQTRVYDGEGKSILTWASCYSNFDSFFFCGVKFKYEDLDTSLNLVNWISMIDNGERLAKTIADSSYQFVLLTLWSKYLGKVALKHLQKVDSITKYSACEVLNIKVNLGAFEED